MTITRTTAFRRHPHTGAPLLPLGYRRDGRPIMPILGAGPEEDDDFEPDGDESDEDESDEDESDEDEDEGEKFTPPTKEEYETLQAALARANKQARDRRLRIKELEKNGKAPDETVLNARAEEVAAGTWKPLVVRGEARSALTEAGLIGKPDRLLKLIDMNEIDVDPETGDIDGLEDQIAELRRDYPHLFRRKGSRRVDAADRGEDRNRSKMTATEIQAAALRGEL